MTKDFSKRLAGLVFPAFGVAVLGLFAWFLYEVANGALDF
jgi:hypothetical protein